MCFHVGITLHHLGITFPHKDGFSKVKDSYIERAFYIVCDDYDVNTNEIWINGSWFYTVVCDNLRDGRKATQNHQQTILHNG